MRQVTGRQDQNWLLSPLRKLKPQIENSERATRNPHPGTRNTQLAPRNAKLHLPDMAGGGDFVVEFAFGLHHFLLVRQPAFFF